MPTLPPPSKKMSFWLSPSRSPPRGLFSWIWPFWKRLLGIFGRTEAVPTTWRGWRSVGIGPTPEWKDPWDDSQWQPNKIVVQGTNRPGIGHCFGRNPEETFISLSIFLPGAAHGGNKILPDLLKVNRNNSRMPQRAWFFSPINSIARWGVPPCMTYILLPFFPRVSCDSRLKKILNVIVTTADSCPRILVLLFNKDRSAYEWVEGVWLRKKKT